MEEYHWPGNVRELRNVVERAVALGFGPMLDASDIWLSSLGAVLTAPPARAYELVSLEMAEKLHILAILECTDWNKSQAATILEIERSTLDDKIKRYGLRRGEATPISSAPAPSQPPEPLLTPTPAVAGRDSGVFGNRAQEKAKIDLRDILKALKEAQWSIGEASIRLFQNRFTLTRTVRKHFDAFPQLRQEGEFVELAEWIRRSGKEE
jgi:transcriptional regulator of acetoin/glycerol metabolism